MLLSVGLFAMPGLGQAGSLPRESSTTAPPVEITILDFSDFHGNLEPVATGPTRLGGAAYLASHFERRAATAANEPFVVTAGDEIGATPPISSLFGDRPTIRVLNMMGLDAGTLGNHNFDRGVSNMRRIAARADYPYVVSNLVGPDRRPPGWVEQRIVWERAGVRIGVTGAINPEAPSITLAGAFGDLRVRDPAPGINRQAALLRAGGVGTVVALVHLGATGAGPDGAGGPLIDLAHRLRGVDLLIGDHTGIPVNQPVTGADGEPVWVVESLSQGRSFAEIKLLIDPETGEALSVRSTFQSTTTDDVEPDARIQTYLDHLREKVDARLRRVVGRSDVPITRSTPLAESNQGNLVTDAMRAAYGVDFAFENSGGLRADLTRDDDKDGDGRYVIRREYVLEMLPFSNVAVTLEVSGPELKEILEHGVSTMPQTTDGRFIQVSGLEFDYRTSRPPGDRVVAVRWPADDSPVDLSEDATYRIAMNDFMVAGGDSYPDLSDRATYRELLDQLVAEYLSANDPVSPEGPISPATVPETRIFRLD